MKSWFALSVFLLILGGMPPRLESQLPPSENLVELPAGTIYNLDEQGNAVRVPLILHEGIESSDLDPVLFDVAFGKVHNTALLLSFRPSLANGALLIAVALDPPLQQGSYEIKLRLLLKGKAKDKVKPLQDLVLQVVQPAAQLRPPKALVIQRTLSLWGASADIPVYPSLPLKESSGLSRLARIDISQVDNFVSATGPVANCVLRFQETSTIPAGKVAWASYDAQCDPTVGTLNGLVQVRAAELVSPVDVNVEIHTKRTRWWIGLMATAGLLLGYLTRIALPLWATRNQVRAQGVSLLAQIDAEVGRRKDAQFQKDCKAIRDTLSQALESSPKPDVLTQAIAKAATDLANALAGLQVRRTMAQATVDQLAKVIGTPWSLPAAIQAVVDSAGPHLIEAHAELLADDAQGAVDTCEVARKEFASKLRKPIQDWQEELLGLLDSLDAAPTPASMTPGLSASVEHARVLVNSVGDPGADPLLDAIMQALSATDVARVAIRQILLRMQSWPQDTMEDVERTLLPSPLIDANVVNDLKDSAKRLLAVLRRAAEAPEAAAPTLKSDLDSLDQSWREALLAQTNDPTQKEAIQASLNQRQYSAAALQVAQMLAGVAVDNAKLAFQAALAAPASPVPWQGISDAHPRDTIPTAGWWNVDLSPGQIPALQARTAQESKLAQFIQTLVAGVGIVFISYLANGDKFLGTFADLAGIFSWAFVSDITIDSLVTAAKGVKKG